eukprot:GAHX01000297.1.p1 GENE.GAHX01000297.1~~GAHX01000297.1.p1  ORF type:complete len:659 (+),score=180.80 GAHX01000297.1:40-1977(+)
MSDLIQYCEDNKITEIDKTLKQREKCLNFLNRALYHFHNLVIEELSSSGMVPSYITKNSIIKLYTFGSFRLGANTPSSDIDALAVGPNFIDRQTFFTDFPSLLNKEKEYFEKLDLFEEVDIPEVTELVAIVDTYVPLIMFKLDGIDFDLLYCQTSLSVITNSFDVLLDFDAIVNDLDELSLRSINGARTTERILDIISKLAPEDNFDEMVSNYRVVLKSVKHWAKQRGIYSNVMGYIGGVSYSILVAKSFQIYYNNNNKDNVNNVNLNSTKKIKLTCSMANELLVHFFKVLSEWDWKTPVELIPSNKIPDSTLSWNPQKNYRDKQDRFPIITPTSPTINSSHNVFESTMDKFLYEFKRAHVLTQLNEGVWEMVFRKSSMFVRYKVFIVVLFKQKTEEADFDKNAGLMKIKTRLLFNGIERVVGLQIVPYSNEITKTVKENGEEYRVQYLLAALKIDKTKGSDRKKVSISSTINLFKEMIDAELWEKTEIKVCHGKDIDSITGEHNREEEVIKYKNEVKVIKELKTVLKKRSKENENKDNNTANNKMNNKTYMDKEVEEGEIIQEDMVKENIIERSIKTKEEDSLEEGQISIPIPIPIPMENKKEDEVILNANKESEVIKAEIMNIKFKTKVVDLNTQDYQDFTKI